MSRAIKDCSDEFLVEDTHVPSKDRPVQRETDQHRIAQRQKQVDLGKNTLGYQRYRQQVSRNRRRPRQDPMTPDVHQVCSKRSFDGQIKKWRRMLHEWDPSDEADVENMEAAAGPSSNPPAPQGSDRSYEHITHEECQEASASATPGSKNGGSLRPASAGGPPQKATLTALRKRNFSESAMTCQSACPLPQPLPPKQAKTSSPPRSSSSSQQVMEAQPCDAAAGVAAPGVGREEPQELVDYGEEEDWAYVEAEEAVVGGTSVYNNWAALEAGAEDGLDEVAV